MGEIKEYLKFTNMRQLDGNYSYKAKVPLEKIRLPCRFQRFGGSVIKLIGIRSVEAVGKMCSMSTLDIKRDLFLLSQRYL